MIRLKIVVTIMTLLAFVFFYPISTASGQSDSVAGQKFTQDAFSFTAGIFNPTEDVIQDIYGTGITFGGTYKINVADRIDFLTGASVIRMAGDAFFDMPDFSTTEDATLIVVPIEFTFRTKF